MNYDPTRWESESPEYAQYLSEQVEPPAYTNMFERIAADYRPGKKLLEVACAGGNDYGHLKRRVDIEPDDYVGVDVTPKYIQLAREKYPDVRWMWADARQLPFADQEFDITLNLQMLLHLDQRGARRAVEEMCRVTKDKVYIWTYASNERFEGVDAQTGGYLYNVMAFDELKVPGWDTLFLLCDGAARQALRRHNLLNAVPEGREIYFEFVLRRK